MVGVRRLLGGHGRASARIPISGANWLIVIAVIMATAMAVGVATRSQGGSSSTTGPTTGYYDKITAVNWILSDYTLLATSSGANVSQGSTFTTSVTVTCPTVVTACSGTAIVNASAAESLGSWPSWVSPCGYLRFVTNITSSNLPLTIPAGGSATIDMTLQAPVATYPNSSGTPVQYNYTAWVDVTLTFAP